VSPPLPLRPLSDVRWRCGIDENGLGSRLGPLIVTGVMAEVTPLGERWLAKRLPVGMAKDLADSKKLVRYGDATRGEAWARALLPDAATPSDLLRSLSLETESELRRPCPSQAAPQCWGHVAGDFSAPEKLLTRVGKHLARMQERGVQVISVRSSLLCVNRLNTEKAAGQNRFTSDLHAMERLILAFRSRAPRDLEVTCGKVGGMSDYPSFFGPLAGRLHTVLQQDRMHSAYRFPGVGDLHFVQDADSADPLVMLASMVGKFVRELCMSQISHFYTAQLDDVRGASGYHDSVTSQFIKATANLRKQQRIPTACFERD
jgi:ribonuclease HII